MQRPVSGDPLAVVWGALEHRDCSPRGSSHDFRARCPGHDGDNALSLHVAEGVDRQVLLHCFAHQCTPERIVDALGLTIADLFPAGHRRARRTSAAHVRRSDLTGNAQVVANTLAALDIARMPWQAMVMTDCPFCGSPGAWLRTASDDAPFVDCPTGCTTGEFTQALAYRLAGAKASTR